MSVSSISSLNNTYGQIASGKKILSAADDASGLAIAEKLESQRNGYDTGSDNAAAGRDMLNVADGALASITDSLQRIRELSVQASNTALYGNDELQAIQGEIDQLKAGINDVANYTQFNGKNLLDGSETEWNLATNPDGTGSTAKLSSSNLEALGIADYDVTGDFDLDAIDAAIDKVNRARGNIGATSNALEYRINYNDYAAYNLEAARSNTEDLDLPKAISEKEKQRVLSEYQMFFMRKKMQEEAGVVNLMKF